MAWYRDGRWDADAIGALFARARTRRFRGRGYEALPPDYWTLRPPVPPASVEGFESTLGVRLPEGYRAFLAQVSDGAPGPGGAEGSLWPLAGRERGGPAGHNVVDPTGPFDFDGPVARAVYGNDDPDSDEYWDHATFLALTGVLDIATFGYPADVYLVLTGPHRGELWSEDKDTYFPLLTPGDGDGDTSDGDDGRYTSDGDGFVAWYSQWLDDLFTDPQQLVEIPEGDEHTDATLAAVARLVQHRRPEAAEELAALVDRDQRGLAACALRALAVVDPEASRQRAETLVDHPDARLAEAAFDIFVALAEPADLPRLTTMIRAAGPAGAIATDNPERSHLEGALIRLGAPGRELLGRLWLDERLGRETTDEDFREFRAQMQEWQRSGQSHPPPGSLPDLAGMGPPTAADLTEDLRAAGEELRESLGDSIDWNAVTETAATLVLGLGDQVSDEVRTTMAEAFQTLHHPEPQSPEPPESAG